MGGSVGPDAMAHGVEASNALARRRAGRCRHRGKPGLLPVQGGISGQPLPAADLSELLAPRQCDTPGMRCQWPPRRLVRSLHAGRRKHSAPRGGRSWRAESGRTPVMQESAVAGGVRIHLPGLPCTPNALRISSATRMDDPVSMHKNQSPAPRATVPNIVRPISRYTVPS